MLDEEFKIWPINFILNVTFFIFEMCILNLDHLEDRPICFTELLDSNMEESNRIEKLDKVAAILNNNNIYSSDSHNLEVKQVKKK